jgi:hypothetical protein
MEGMAIGNLADEGARPLGVPIPATLSQPALVVRDESVPKVRLKKAPRFLILALLEILQTRGRTGVFWKCLPEQPV